MGEPAPLGADDFVSKAVVQAPVSSSKSTEDVSLDGGYIDHGAVCDGKAGVVGGCFMSDAKRLRVIEELRARISNANTNYKLAVAELKVALLVQKEEDLPWVLSLALDLAGGYLVTIATSLLKAGSESVRKSLAKTIDGRYVSDRSFASKVDTALGSITEKGIESTVKAGFKSVPKAGEKAAKNDIAAANGVARGAQIAFLDQLRDSCDVQFNVFASKSAGSANDAELALLWDAMNPEHHVTGAYKAALGAKLERFRKSGAVDIGVRPDFDRDFGRAAVYRHTRVVWVQQFNGARTLWYQSQEGDRDVADMSTRGSAEIASWWSTLAPGTRPAFEPRDARELARLERPVPAEFVDTAVGVNESMWGSVTTISDGAERFFQRRKGVSLAVKAPPITTAVASPTNAPVDVVPVAKADAE